MEEKSPAQHKKRKSAAEASEVKTGARGLALHIGLNNIDPDVYGSDGALSGCVNDAVAMRKIATHNGFNCMSLINADATRQNVIGVVLKASKILNEGDVFLLTYSGHGSSIPDTNGDEDDHRDETWCLYDGMLLDDEIHLLLCEFRSGVRVVVVSDSCHSGTVIKDIFASAELSKNIPRQLPFSVMLNYTTSEATWLANLKRDVAARPNSRREPAASVILLAGCQDNQFSSDGPMNGAFTAALLHEYYAENGPDPPNKTYASFLKAIRVKMPPVQTPNFLTLGGNDPAFQHMKPFSLSAGPARPCSVSGSVSTSGHGDWSGNVSVSCTWK